MRYLPHTDADRAGDARAGSASASIDELFADIPADKRLDGPPRPADDQERDRGRAASSAGWRRGTSPAGSVPFFVGAGAYRHHVPASVDHLIQRSEFLTSYTPYQPEIAQGTLQYLFEFQTQVANLTGMEVANASMYDGSTAHRRGGADGAPRDQAAEGGALRRPPPAISRASSRPCRAWPATRSWRLPPDPTRHRGDPRRDRRRDLLRRRPVAVLLRPPHRPRADRREGARGRRAARRGLHRGRVARRHRAAGRAGRRHRRRRGPVDRQPADLRRPLCRPLRDAAEIHPPDAGPALRRDGRRRGPARLRADALDPRAAHPPRQGDLEHLHQFRPLLPRLHHPHDAARRDRACAGSRRSTTPTPCSSPNRCRRFRA